MSTDAADPLSVDDFLRESATEVDEGGKLVEQRLEDVLKENARRKGRDRSKLAGVIIWTYAIAVTLVILYTLGAEIAVVAVNCLSEDTADCKAILTDWKDRTDGVLAVLTTAVLPIVTLMLGFYFGTEQRDAAAEKDGNG